MNIRKKLPLIVAFVTCGGTYIVVSIFLSQIFEKKFIASHSGFGAIVACGALFLTWKVLSLKKHHREHPHNQDIRDH